jgi:hypothetical protein
MWESCGGKNNGVGVKSNVGALKAALRRSTQKVHISNVLYIDYDTAPIPLGNAFFSALHKDESFRQEREVRALLLHVGRKAEVFSLGPERGVDVNIDTADLIKELHISPQSDPCFHNLVADVSKRYGTVCTILPADPAQGCPAGSD